MKKSVGCIVVVALLLPSLGMGKGKEGKIDPRLKQIHAIFLQGAFSAVQEVRDKQAEIEKGSCLKLVQNAEAADAVVKVSYTPGFVGQTQTVGFQLPGMGISEVRPYHTAFELSVPEGKKMKKIWERHVDLDHVEQETQPGVFRLMDLLRQDACGGR